jgi:hypothetical protein
LPAVDRRTLGRRTRTAWCSRTSGNLAQVQLMLYRPVVVAQPRGHVSRRCPAGHPGGSSNHTVSALVKRNRNLSLRVTHCCGGQPEGGAGRGEEGLHCRSAPTSRTWSHRHRRRSVPESRLRNASCLATTLSHPRCLFAPVKVPGRQVAQASSRNAGRPATAGCRSCAAKPCAISRLSTSAPVLSLKDHPMSIALQPPCPPAF